MALISTNDFDALPVERVRRWLALRDLLERRLVEVSDPSEGSVADDLVEYCTVLVYAAEELELGKFESFSVADIRQHYPELRAAIIALATRLSMRSSTANAAFSVALPQASKTKLYSQIEKLRTYVAASGLSEKQKQKLFTKLDELHEIIVAPRTDFGRLMAIVAFIAASVGGTTTFLAEAPEAVNTILAIVGEAKEAEEQHHQMIQARKAPLQIQDLRNSVGDGDEIPF